MTHRRGFLSTIATVAIAGGGFCFAQQADPSRAGAGAGAGAAAHDAPAGAAAGHDAAAGKQVDQQIDQQLQKIQQQKDNLAGDRLFVLNTAIGNHFEMAFAQMAQQKSQDQQVKQLAQRILQDHQQAGQQLQQVAQKLQLDLPQGLPSMKQQELQIIGGMDSKMFDQKFVASMDEHHAKDVTCFRNTTQTAQSPDVKQFASQTLPKLQEHWQLTKRTATAVGLQSDMEAQPAGGRIQGTPRSDTPRSDTPGSTTPGSSTPRSDAPRSDSTPGTSTPASASRDPDRANSGSPVPGGGGSGAVGNPKPAVPPNR